MAAGQGGMDRAELKKHIQFAREEAVQLAFAIGGDGEAVIHMHRRKPGRALEKELKEASPDSKNHRWGTLQMDPDTPKLARVVVNKAGGGLSRKLGKALKGTGCGKVQIMLEDGTEVDVHEEEDGDVDIAFKPSGRSADGPDESGGEQGDDDKDRAAPPGDGLLARGDDATPGPDLGDIPVSPRMVPPSNQDVSPGTEARRTRSPHPGAVRLGQALAGHRETRPVAAGRTHHPRNRCPSEPSARRPGRSGSGN